MDGGSTADYMASCTTLTVSALLRKFIDTTFCDFQWRKKEQKEVHVERE